jgi:hypothetical protein
VWFKWWSTCLARTRLWAQTSVSPHTKQRQSFWLNLFKYISLKKNLNYNSYFCLDYFSKTIKHLRPWLEFCSVKMLFHGSMPLIQLWVSLNFILFQQKGSCWNAGCWLLLWKELHSWSLDAVTCAVIFFSSHALLPIENTFIRPKKCVHFVLGFLLKRSISITVSFT